MINYRVEGLDQLLAQMKAAGILPTDSVEKVSYGKFVHLMDPEGNKIELWEPNDVEFAKMGTNTTK
jgi:predicted enzyme related to lactoylglutathione lyase